MSCIRASADSPQAVGQEGHLDTSPLHPGNIRQCVEARDGEKYGELAPELDQGRGAGYSLGVDAEARRSQCYHPKVAWKSGFGRRQELFVKLSGCDSAALPVLWPRSVESIGGDRHMVAMGLDG